MQRISALLVQESLVKPESKQPISCFPASALVRTDGSINNAAHGCQAVSFIRAAYNKDPSGPTHVT